MSISTRVVRLSVAMAAVAVAQTPSEYDTIKQALLTVAQKASSSLAVLDAPSRPLNWPSLMAADMDAAISAAAAASNAARTATVGKLISVPAGGSLQAAVNSALPGDTIVLQAGATYTGLVSLPAKPGTAYVTITTSALAGLPEGQRVAPASAVYMPRIVNSTGGPAFVTAAGAHHYKLTGLEVTCPAGIYCNTLIQLGTGSETTDAALPYAIELDRVYVHGSSGGGKRGVQLNGKSVTLRNSHVSGLFSSTQETQAVGAWNTPGPITIDGNYLEASGMGILIGGAEPALIGVTPSDIQIIRNHITRPLAWRSLNYMVKNLVELKTGRRVRITGNVLENSWTASQVGYAFNLKAGTENVKTPALTTDVVVSENIIRRTAAAVSISGSNATGGVCSNITVRNNLFEDIGPAWGSAPPLFGIYGVLNATIENNTAGLKVLSPHLLMSEGKPSSGFVFRANIFPYGTYGVKGSGTATGTATLNSYFPGSVFTNNVLYGATVNAATYPPGNYFPPTTADVGFTDAANGKYKLSAVSTYRGTGPNGQDPGIGLGPLFQ